MRDFVIMGTLQFVSYLNLTLNIRAISHEQYAVAALTDAAAGILGWTIIKRIAGYDGSTLGKVGYVAGGALASMVGIWLTRAW